MSSVDKGPSIQSTVDFDLNESGADGNHKKLASIVVFYRGGAEVASMGEEVEVVVGRASSADLIVEAPSLSREHARFSWIGNQIRVQDLDSRNGTYINGQRVKDTFIASGDQLELGGLYAFVVVLSPNEQSVGVIESFASLHRQLHQEALRTASFGDSFALVMMRARDEQGLQKGNWIQAVRAKLRNADRLALYNKNTLIALLPKTTHEQALALTSELLNAQGAPVRLFASVGSFPITESSVEAFFGVVHDALARTNDQMRIVDVLPTYGRASPSPQRVVVIDPKMQELYKLMQQVASRDIPVLILGETGTGKEILAKATHEASQRSKGPFIAISCAAIPGSLAESILFGHEKGAFTSADRRRLGIFEEADGGTVFLDEIGELSAENQAILLRVLDTKRINRLGSTKEIEVDVRLIAATHRDLSAMVREGLFRSDLLYRINTVTLEIPPLRERKGEIEKLAEHFLQTMGKNHKSGVRAIHLETLAYLKQYNWPGNVRELRNVIERACAICRSDKLCPEDLPRELRQKPPGTLGHMAKCFSISASLSPELDEYGQSFKERIEAYELHIINEALKECGGNRTHTAKQLKMPRRTLVRKLKAYSIEGYDQQDLFDNE